MRTPERLDVDPYDSRDETEDERMDRNWNELLQELRITQTGTQILAAFLLAIAFQPTFAGLSSLQHGIYLTLVGAAVLTIALGLTPVNLHRALFRRHSKRLLVAISHVVVRCTLVGVAVIIIGVVLLVFDVVLGLRPALFAAAGTLAVLVAVALIPVVLRRRVSSAEEALRARVDRPRS